MGLRTGRTQRLYPNNAKPSGLLLAWGARDVGARSGTRAALIEAVPNRAINLTFHGVGEPPRPLPSGERDVWVSSELFGSCLAFAANRDDIAISFDDGNASDVEQALPALIEHGLRATFFIVAGRVGEEHFVDWDGLRALVAAGMEIGCHGMRHRPWRGLDHQTLREEVLEAKLILERLVGRQISRAACPFGSYDRRALSALRRCGYTHVYTSDRGTASEQDFLQARNSVRSDDSVDLLERLARGGIPAHELLRRRAKLAMKRWR